MGMQLKKKAKPHSVRWFCTFMFIETDLDVSKYTAHFVVTIVYCSSW